MLTSDNRSWRLICRRTSRNRSLVPAPILNIAGQNAYAEQETERVDEDVTLAALDFLARVKTMQVDR